MSERNYWQRMRSSQLSRRALLRASARAGVGATGLALVGCGDDDDDAQQTAAQAQHNRLSNSRHSDRPNNRPCSSNKLRRRPNSRPRPGEEQEQAAVAVAEEQAVASGEIDTEATLRLALASDNGGLDPIRSGSQVNYINSHGVFERSVWLEPDKGTPQPNLLSWENPDELIWSLTVKDNVFFHNGQQLTAEDIIFTYERVGNIAEYHQGGETSDHPAGWASARTPHAPPLGGLWANRQTALDAHDQRGRTPRSRDRP